MQVSEITEEILSNSIIDRLLYKGLRDTGENVDRKIATGEVLKGIGLK